MQHSSLTHAPPFKVGAITHANLRDSMRWEPERGTHLVVLDLLTGESWDFVCDETFFGFHFSNAHVDLASGDIVADVVTYADDALFEQMFLDAWRNGSAVDRTSLSGTLQRVTIPFAGRNESAPEAGGKSTSFLGNGTGGTRHATRLASALARVKPITPVLIEAPRINDAYHM